MSRFFALNKTCGCLGFVKKNSSLVYTNHSLLKPKQVLFTEQRCGIYMWFLQLHHVDYFYHFTRDSQHKFFLPPWCGQEICVFNRIVICNANVTAVVRCHLRKLPRKFRKKKKRSYSWLWHYPCHRRKLLRRYVWNKAAPVKGAASFAIAHVFTSVHLRMARETGIS